MAATAGFESTTFRPKGIDSTNAPPPLLGRVLIIIMSKLWRSSQKNSYNEKLSVLLFVIETFAVFTRSFVNFTLFERIFSFTVTVWPIKTNCNIGNNLHIRGILDHKCDLCPGLKNLTCQRTCISCSSVVLFSLSLL